MKKAVFLDRDGTIIEEVNYLSQVSQVKLMPGTVEGLKLLQNAGFTLVIVTNQSGVAKGVFTEQRLHEIHRHLTELLLGNGIKLDGIYYCPHHPESGLEGYCTVCNCRKPKTGLYQEAAEKLNISFADSFAVGDKFRDIVGPCPKGCQPILVRTGYGTSEEGKLKSLTNCRIKVAGDILEAANMILQSADNAKACGCKDNPKCIAGGFAK